MEIQDSSHIDVPYWVRAARAVSWVSIIFTIIGGIGGLAIAIITKSSSILSLSLQSFTDIFSSVLVLWRFAGVVSGDHELRERENRGSVIVAMFFFLIALTTFLQGVIHLAIRKEIEDSRMLVVIASVSFVVMGLLGGIKFFIARKLQSSTMTKDGIASTAVSFLSLGLLISTLLYRSDRRNWWIDSVFSVFISCVLITISSGTLFCHGHKWWLKEFWKKPAS